MVNLFELGKTDSTFQKNAGLIFDNILVTSVVLKDHKVDAMYDPQHVSLFAHIKQVGSNSTCFENNLRTIHTRTGTEYQILKQAGLHFQENGQSILWFLSCANYSQVFTDTGNIMCHSWTSFDQNFQIRIFNTTKLELELITYFQSTATLITKANSINP